MTERLPDPLDKRIGRSEDVPQRKDGIVNQATETERINPLTDEPLTKKQIEMIDKIADGQRIARKAARSGNPAVRGPAKRFLALVPRLRRRVYAGYTR